MDRVAKYIKVYVDGVEVNSAIKFNIAEGWVECAVTSPSGYCNVDASVGDILTSRLYGHIEIGDTHSFLSPYGITNDMVKDIIEKIYELNKDGVIK